MDKPNFAAIAYLDKPSYAAAGYLDKPSSAAKAYSHKHLSVVAGYLVKPSSATMGCLDKPSSAARDPCKNSAHRVTLQSFEYSVANFSKPCIKYHCRLWIVGSDFLETGRRMASPSFGSRQQIYRTGHKTSFPSFGYSVANFSKT